MPDRFGDLVASARDILATLDQSGSFTYVSPSIQQTLGLIPAEVVGSVIWELVHPRDVAGVHRALTQVFSEGGRRHFTFQMQDVGGAWHTLDSTFQFLDNDVPEASLAATDVTELRQLSAKLKARDEQLRQAQKMEVVGRLASGISHDFGNLLTIIIGATGQVADQLPEDSPHRSAVASIQISAERAASMVRQLLGFGRQRIEAPVALDLNEVVTQLEQMIVRLVGEHIAVRTICEPDLWPVLADQVQIEQVLLNLAVNARDAMPGGGTLLIETRNVPEGDTTPGGNLPSVVVSVTDTGIGMDEATRARAFEPFFTTKSIGMGTGIGLATVRQIVRDAGGWTSLSSVQGQGTTVVFGLPRTAAAAEVVAASPASSDAGGSETLLVVEDEEGVRELVSDMLTLAGYHVIEAASPSEAQLLSASHSGAIDLLLTDVVMPEMSGLDLSRRLQQMRPRMQVMYMSGFPEPVVGDGGGEVPGAHFISKPFNRSALLERVRRALDAAETSRS